jgi:hypothetical protein
MDTLALCVAGEVGPFGQADAINWVCIDAGLRKFDQWLGHPTNDCVFGIQEPAIPGRGVFIVEETPRSAAAAPSLTVSKGQ